GHPCCSAMCFVVAYAHLGLSPIRKRPCWANKTAALIVISKPPFSRLYSVLAHDDFAATQRFFY
ncbi:MAG: hypothetical protein E6749_21100, partial [Enterocloster clostridioformis]|uniref:hypothetical protein n=2 Tax=Enterocloster clostridioformis TaxID=1531 RepID=UPI00290408CA